MLNETWLPALAVTVNVTNLFAAMFDASVSLELVYQVVPSPSARGTRAGGANTRATRQSAYGNAWVIDRGSVTLGTKIIGSPGKTVHVPAGNRAGKRERWTAKCRNNQNGQPEQVALQVAREAAKAAFRGTGSFQDESRCGFHVDNSPALGGADGLLRWHRENATYDRTHCCSVLRAERS